MISDVPSSLLVTSEILFECQRWHNSILLEMVELD